MASSASGLVIGTDPVAGTEVERSTSVDYTVSRGPEPTLEPTPEPTAAPVVVPDLRGFTPEDAVNALIDVGLQPGERTDKLQQPRCGGPGHPHRPRSGHRGRAGVRGRLRRVLGAEPTPTPGPPRSRRPRPSSCRTLRGFAEPDAINALLEVGLQAGTRSDAFDTEIAADLVIGTDPRRAPRWNLAARSGYVVSLGVEPTIEPTAQPTPAAGHRPEPPRFDA